MADGFDPTGHPGLAAYLAGLPHGLESYPACRTKASLFRTMLDVHQPRFRAGALPAELQRPFDAPPPPSAWIGEVEYQAALLAVGDLRGLSNQRYPELPFEVARHLFESPMYRVLMHVASPAWLLKGTSLRWSQFRKGTKLNARTGRDEVSVRLTFPPGLFNQRCLVGFTRVFRACLVAAGKPEGAVVLERSRGENAIFTASW